MEVFVNFTPLSLYPIRASCDVFVAKIVWFYFLSVSCKVGSFQGTRCIWKLLNWAGSIGWWNILQHQVLRLKTIVVIENLHQGCERICRDSIFTLDFLPSSWGWERTAYKSVQCRWVDSSLNRCISHATSSFVVAPLTMTAAAVASTISFLAFFKNFRWKKRK